MSWLEEKVIQFLNKEISLEELKSNIDLKPQKINSQLKHIKLFLNSSSETAKFLSLLNLSSRKTVLKFLQRIDYKVIESNTFVSPNTVSEFFNSDNTFSIKQEYLYKFAIILDIPSEILCRQELTNIQTSFSEYFMQNLNQFINIEELILHTVHLLNTKKINRYIDGCTFLDPDNRQDNKLYLARIDVRNDFFTIEIFFEKGREITYLKSVFKTAIKESLIDFNVILYVQHCLFREEEKFVILCYRRNISLDKVLKKIPIAERTFFRD